MVTSQGFIQPRESERKAQAQDPGKTLCLQTVGAGPGPASFLRRRSLSSSPAPQLTQRGEGGDGSGGSEAAPPARLRPSCSPFLGNSQFPVWLRRDRRKVGLLLFRAPRRAGAAWLRDRGRRRGRGGWAPLTARPLLARDPPPTPEAPLGPLPAQAQSAWRQWKGGGGRGTGGAGVGWGAPQHVQPFVLRLRAGWRGARGRHVVAGAEPPPWPPPCPECPVWEGSLKLSSAQSTPKPGRGPPNLQPRAGLLHLYLHSVDIRI